MANQTRQELEDQLIGHLLRTIKKIDLAYWKYANKHFLNFVRAEDGLAIDALKESIIKRILLYTEEAPKVLKIFGQDDPIDESTRVPAVTNVPPTPIEKIFIDPALASYLYRILNGEVHINTLREYVDANEFHLPIKTRERIVADAEKTLLYTLLNVKFPALYED
ncbi:MAG: hypothetical protein COA82_03570 [Alkaliphilus sp.]|nr:MAG: hypothetical protein COA82_03570 [Alkaliphilus sp.]